MPAATDTPPAASPDALAELCDRHHAVTDPGVLEAFAVDWTGLWQGSTPVLFRPRSSAAAAALVADAARLGVPLQLQGGNTSLAGGSVPYGAPVLSTAHLDRVELDLGAARATVGAGVTAGELAAALAGTGLELGVDLASRDSATIGGMVSTNAGGLRTLRWGMMASQVLGAEVVLGSGERLERLDPPDRDNSGVRWPQLLCGAEGTLGLVCAVTLRLVPVEAPVCALVAFDDVAGALTVAARARTAVPNLRSVELMLAEGVELVAEHLGAAPPLSGRLHPAYLLVEASGVPLEVFAEGLGGCLAGVGVAAEGFAQGPARETLWRWRERHTEAIAAVGVAASATCPPHPGGSPSSSPAQLTWSPSGARRRVWCASVTSRKATCM